MKTLLSGLDEDTCHRIVGSSLKAGQSIRWHAPDKLLQLLADEAAPPPARRVIWFYRSPTTLVEGAPDKDARDLQVELDLWLEHNRAVLNLRRRLGTTLLLVNVDNVSAADLNAALADADSNAAPGAARATPPAAGAKTGGPGTQCVIQHLFEWIAPRYCEVFESLEAASWLPKSEPAFRSTVTPGEVHLVATLEALRNGAALPGRTLELASAKEQLASTRGQIEAERKAADIAARNCEQLRRDCERLRQENQDLLLELHQVQEEFEQYYLKSVDLAKRIDDEERWTERVPQGQQHSDGFSHEQEKQHLLIQLHQVQEELEQYYRKSVELSAVTSAAPPKVAAPSGADAVGRPSLAARLVPGRLRARLEHAKARRAHQARLDAIRKSQWFDRGWYLDTYADVRAAEMDPVEHYSNFGWREGRDPSPGFDTRYYLQSNPDVASSGLDPLWHFIAYGLKEGRLPRKP